MGPRERQSLNLAGMEEHFTGPSCLGHLNKALGPCFTCWFAHLCLVLKAYVHIFLYLKLLLRSNNIDLRKRLHGTWKKPKLDIVQFLIHCDSKKKTCPFCTPLPNHLFCMNKHSAVSMIAQLNMLSMFHAASPLHRKGFVVFASFLLHALLV